MDVVPLRAVRSPHGTRPRRVAVLSVHTSPLEQPGIGDAGGLNVYVVETARRLAESGVEVEVFTRATSGDSEPVVELAPGVTVRHVIAGPLESLPKNDLPAQLCALFAGVLRAEASHDEGWYDLIHSHYWLSGQVGWLAKERWGVPLVHSMHTMARVKNLTLAAGDTPEPRMRIIGEQQVVDAADRLVANTTDEAAALTDLYGADPDRIAIVHPGVDLERFRPGSRAEARAAVGLPQDALLVLFVGRIQPLKAPDVLIRATAELVAARPELASRLVVMVCGGASGAGTADPDGLQKLAASLGIADIVRFNPPMPHDALRDWYRAADLVAVPSYSESFGLVAVEAQACGTPVVAADVGGLRTAVDDGHSGVLVPDHHPARWARTLGDLLEDPARRAVLGRGAALHARRFGWGATTAATLDVYAGAMTASAAATGRTLRAAIR